MDKSWISRHFFYHSDLRKLLRNFASPLLATLLSRKLIDRFFYISYPLGGPHIRLRFRLIPGREAEVEGLLAEHRLAFLEKWPAETSLDPETIREQSRAILAAAPEPGELFYANGSLVPLPFVPETARYGGPELLGASLDFFCLSSLCALSAIADGELETPGRRWTRAIRVLFRQAWGFAGGDPAELLSLLSYRLPVGDALVDALLERADTSFDKNPGSYVSLVRGELLQLDAAEGGAGLTPAVFVEAARRLSHQVRAADPASRWQLTTSQLHMSANRLLHPPSDELYMLRILWRACRGLAEAEPATWQSLHQKEAQRKVESAGRAEKVDELLARIYERLPHSPEPVPPIHSDLH